MPCTTGDQSGRPSAAQLWLEGGRGAEQKSLACTIKLQGVRFSSKLLASPASSTAPTIADARRLARELVAAGRPSSMSTGKPDASQRRWWISTPWTQVRVCHPIVGPWRGAASSSNNNPLQGHPRRTVYTHACSSRSHGPRPQLASVSRCPAANLPNQTVHSPLPQVRDALPRPRHAWPPKCHLPTKARHWTPVTLGLWFTPPSSTAGLHCTIKRVNALTSTEVRFSPTLKCGMQTAHSRACIAAELSCHAACHSSGTLGHRGLLANPTH